MPDTKHVATPSQLTSAQSVVFCFRPPTPLHSSGMTPNTVLSPFLIQRPSVWPLQSAIEAGTGTWLDTLLSSSVFCQSRGHVICPASDGSVVVWLDAEQQRTGNSSNKQALMGLVLAATPLVDTGNRRLSEQVFETIERRDRVSVGSN